MTDKWVLRAGVIATVTFWGALFMFAALYPGYTHFHKAISELSAFGAPNALAWNLIGFIIPGILLAVCGSGITRRVDGRRTSLYWLLILSGLGFSGAGVFPAVMQDGSPAMELAWTMGHVIMSFVSGFPWVIASALLVLHVGSSRCTISCTSTYSTKSLGFFINSVFSRMWPAAALQLPHLVFMRWRKYAFTETLHPSTAQRIFPACPWCQNANPGNHYQQIRSAPY